MIDPQTETILGPTAASKLRLLQRDGRKPHVRTIRRWWTQGVQRDGRTIKLETIKLPAGTFTSREAIERFICALNSPDDGTNTPTPMQIGREHERAERALEASGI